MANKHMKRHSSLGTREVDVKTTITYHDTPIRTTKSKCEITEVW